MYNSDTSPRFPKHMGEIKNYDDLIKNSLINMIQE